MVNDDGLGGHGTGTAEVLTSPEELTSRRELEAAAYYQCIAQSKGLRAESFSPSGHSCRP